jgi:hypothetical protein
VLENVSPALQDRLGPAATVGLLALLDASRRDWSGEMIEQSVQRFERRLTEETSSLRMEFQQSMSDLRLDFARLETSVERALLTQTRWMFGMWVGQLAATAAMMAAMFQIFTQ